MLITCGSRQIKAKVFGGACSRRLFKGIIVLGDNKRRSKSADVRRKPFCYHSMTLLPPLARPNPSLLPGCWAKAGPGARPGAFHRKHLIGHSSTCGTKTSVDQRTNGAMIFSHQSKSIKQQRSLKRLSFFIQFGLRAHENTPSLMFRH